MRQLLPHMQADVDPAVCIAADHRPAPRGRPWVLCNMVTSVDGATSVSGRSGALSGPADKVVFAAIRAVADVILVAAGTVRAEGYHPPRCSDAVQRERTERGQQPLPRLVIVSATLDLDPSASAFADSTARPLIVTCGRPGNANAHTERAARLADVADVVTIGDHTVDLTAALAHLSDPVGARVVVVEGGPSFNGALVEAQLVDEWCLTVSNTLVAGESARAAHSPIATVTRLHLQRVLEQDGMLFTRYTRADLHDTAHTN